VIPIAGDQITNDIAMALRTPTPDAENIKIRHGVALASVCRATSSAARLADAALDHVVRVCELAQCHAVPDLDVLGIRRRRTQRHRYVVGDLVAAIGSPPYGGCAMREHGDVVRAAADVEQTHAEILLVLRQHRARGGERCRIRSFTSSPQRRTHLTTFCAGRPLRRDICTFTSRRTPDMPMGSRTSSWPSMMNS